MCNVLFGYAVLVFETDIIEVCCLLRYFVDGVIAKPLPFE